MTIMDWYLTDFPSSHSASRVPTSSHHFRPIPTPLVPFWFCMPTSASFTPDAMQFAPCQYTLPPFGPRRLPFSAAFFFFLSPLPSPHLSKSSSSLPSINYFHFYFSRTKRCIKSNFIFFFAIKHATHATQRKHPLRGLSMYLFPPSPVVFISHKQKKGIGCVVKKRKKRALRYNRQYQKLKITDSFFFFLAIAAITISTIIQNKKSVLLK